MNFWFRLELATCPKNNLHNAFCHEDDSISIVVEDDGAQAFTSFQLKCETGVVLFHDGWNCLEHFALGQVVLERFYDRAIRSSC